MNILAPGAGVGGHCIAVDPWFIVDAAPEQSALIRTARNVNDGKPRAIVREIVAHAAKFKRPVVACYGATYKADVEDVRGSPALSIVEELLAENLAVVICDPSSKCCRKRSQTTRFWNWRTPKRRAGRRTSSRFLSGIPPSGTCVARTSRPRS